MRDVRSWNAGVIREFRDNAGRMGGQFEGVPLLLLHTTGARTGLDRVSPVVYLDLDGRRFVFASKAGAARNPDWCRNLLADPEVTVETGTETYRATAVVIEGEERDRLYAEESKRYPVFVEYQERTSRVIPVVELRRS